MKTVVLYYSFEGHTQQVAEKIATTLSADLIRVEPVKDIPRKGFFKFFMGGMLASLKRKVALQPILKDLSVYDRIVIGTPVWAGTVTPSVRTLLSQHSFEGTKVALFSCFAGESGKSLDELKKLIPGADIIGEKGFRMGIKPEDPNDMDTVIPWAESLN